MFLLILRAQSHVTPTRASAEVELCSSALVSDTTHATLFLKGDTQQDFKMELFGGVLCSDVVVVVVELMIMMYRPSCFCFFCFLVDGFYS